jgi:hypothetical protein
MTSSRLLAAAAVAPMLLAACGGASHGQSRSSVDQRALVALRQLAQCVRQHGIPSFPDPQVGSDGVPRYPDSAPRVPAATRVACRTVAARIPPDYTSTTPVSTNDFQKLVQLARCIRAHGIPDWPDPNRLGEFPIDAHIQHGGKRLFVPAVHVCARLDPNPSGGINVVRAQPNP